MREDAMQELIDELNSGKLKMIIHSQELSKNVVFANIWKEKPHENSKLGGNVFDSYYLIKKSDGEFIGLVYLMDNDLHWFMCEEYRGRGYMTYVLNDTVLPHLLNYRPKIEISIDFNGCEYANKSENLAKRCGFRKNKEGRYYYSKRFSKAVVKIINPIDELSEDRYFELQNEVTILLYRFEFIKSELDMKKHDNELSKHLKNVIKSVKEIKKFLVL